jgi:hypothetical protein
MYTAYINSEKTRKDLTMKLSHAEFKKLAQSHLTAEDHLKLAEHFAAHAAEHETDSKVHEELGGYYEKKEPRLAGEARHYAAHSREAAEALRSLARIHQELAAEHKVHAHA